MFNLLFYLIISLNYCFANDVLLSSHDYDKKLYFVVELNDNVDLSLIRRNDWNFEQSLGSLKNHYLFSVDKSNIESRQLLHNIGQHHTHPNHHLEEEPVQHDSTVLQKRRVYSNELKSDGLKYLQIVNPHRLSKRLPIPAPPLDSSFQKVQNAMTDLHISDPLFANQWHLINPLQPGNDINVTDVWSQNITGKGIAVAVVDDGLDMDHDDLKANYFAEGSWDFNDRVPDPKPRLSDDRHGTRCCGEIAAVRNDVCGVGVAYDAKIAGIRILSKQISEAEEALSLNYAMDKNDIYSCSWGPPDDGVAMASPGLVVKKALLNGVQNGRKKLGSLFVFASGNGASFGDNCNFDGYTNSIYSITVAAIDRLGLHPFYSEACSANMIVTYSSDAKDKIVTTDVNGQCTDQHGGTSAAAPIAAGIYALVLSARPDLSWRDLQYLTVDTAVQVNEDEPGWQTTSIGKKFHHKYGYGKLDAFRIVERAKEWVNVKPQAWFFSSKQKVNKPIAFSSDGANGGAKSTITITKKDLEASNLEKIEHVNVLINIKQENRGVLTIVLTSPDGVKSELAAPRARDTSNSGIIDWTFMTVAHWGESGLGDWQLHAYNDKKEGVSGEFIDWTLKLWGQAKDEKKAKLFSLDETEEGESSTIIESATSSVSTATSTSDSTPTSTSESTPTSTNESTPTSISGTPSTTSSTPSTTTTEASASPSSSTSPSSIWSLIPSFGLTGNTLSWVYGSILLIAGFILGICTYIFISKRQDLINKFKRRQSMSSYEFDLIPGADVDEEHELFGIDDSDDDHPSPPDHTPTESEIEFSGENKLQKSTRKIYDTYTQRKESGEETEIFRVDSEDEETEATTSSTSSSNDKEERNHLLP